MSMLPGWGSKYGDCHVGLSLNIVKGEAGRQTQNSALKLCSMRKLGVMIMTPLSVMVHA